MFGIIGGSLGHSDTIDQSNYDVLALADIGFFRAATLMRTWWALRLWLRFDFCFLNVTYRNLARPSAELTAGHESIDLLLQIATLSEVALPCRISHILQRVPSSPVARRNDTEGYLRAY